MQNLPNNLYLAEQVREMDRMAIADYAIPGIDLMRKAGQVVFDLIQEHYSTRAITIFCGAGNNAGDGYVAATLARQAGLDVKVYYLSNPDKLKGDAATAYQDYIAVGGQLLGFESRLKLVDGIIVDALLGTGLDRVVSGRYAEAVALINQSGMPVVAVDIPSGLYADTGVVMGCCIKALWTVTFIGLKQGMFTGIAADYCGQIIYSSLNIPDTIFKALTPAATLISQPLLSKRLLTAHKGHYGHVLLIGGDDGFTGAIRLAAEASQRIGAGLVSIATRKSHANYINIARPELMCHGVDNADQLKHLIDLASVVVIGPGLGQSKWAQDLFDCVVSSDKALVIDADALNLLAKRPLQRDNWILTPHPGEATRLLACSTVDIANNRFLAVAQLQKQYAGIVVLKGAGTLIANGEEITVSTTGNPGMASGGMGDVLAGMIAGLVAQKYVLNQAAKMAVYLHGEAADLSAQAEGERGMLASDLMPFIRKLMNR